MKENMVYPIAESISKSMLGNGNSSLGQAQLRFLKSTQHRIYPFFFFTSTILDNHLRCWIGLINLVASSFYTSCIIWFSTLVWNTLVGWAIGLVPGSTFSNFSSAITCISYFAIVVSSSSASFTSFEPSWATQHIKALCWGLPLGPTYALQVGPTHLCKLYIVLPSNVLTLM